MSRFPQENSGKKETQNLIKRLENELSDCGLFSLVKSRLELCDELEKKLKHYEDLEKVRRTW